MSSAPGPGSGRRTLAERVATSPRPAPIIEALTIGHLDNAVEMADLVLPRHPRKEQANP